MIRSNTRTASIGVLAMAAALSLALQTVARAADPHAGHAGHGAMGHAMAAQKADPAKATRTVQLTLADLSIQPATLSVRKGETVKFVVKNTGALLHAVEIGSPEHHMAAQKHTAMMRDHGMITDTAISPEGMKMDHSKMDHSKMDHSKMDQGKMDHSKMDHAAMGHGMGHEDMATLLVEPGKTAEIAYTFAAAGELEIACSIPGHYEAGMAVPLPVAAK